MNDGDHPYVRALALIDALLRLCDGLQAENVMLRATFEGRLDRLEQQASSAPVRVAPIVSLTGRRCNRVQQAQDVLRAGPMRNAEVARRMNLPPSNSLTTLQALQRVGIVVQDNDKRWRLTVQDAACA